MLSRALLNCKCDRIGSDLGKSIAGSFECRFLPRRRYSHGGPAMARHLTFAERELLQRMVAKRKSRAEIADLMNRHRSTIYRELDRNSTPFGYRPKTAQRMAVERRAACHRHYKLKNRELCLYVSQRLKQAWS